MTARRITLALLLAAIAFPLPAADPSAAVKVADLAWLTGTWKTPVDEKNGPSEETWSTPAAGSLVGMFRLAAPGKAPLFEFLLIEDEGTGATLRFRHFRPGMSESEKAPLKLALTELTAKQLVFTNHDGAAPKQITYGRTTADSMAIDVETLREGKPYHFKYRVERVKPK